MRVWLVSLFVVVSACGRAPHAKAPPQPLSATWNAPAILGHVPADSPYVIAVLDVAKEFRERTFAMADEKLAEAMRELDDLPPDFDRNELPPHLRALLAVMEELRGKDIKNWAAELGFDPSGRFVIYGLSIWPVIRVAVKDPVKMRRIAKRAVAASGMTLDEGVLAGKAYWRLTKAETTLIAAVLDDEAVVAVVPTSSATRALPFVLGTEKPARSLRETNIVPALVKQYKLLPSLVGYVDVRAIADIITQRAQSAVPGLDEPLRKATGAVTAECRTDIDRLVAVMPRMVLGYRKLDATGMHARLIAEMPQALTSEIAKLRVAVPGVTAGFAERPLGAFGIAMKVEDTLALLARLTAHVHMRPFQCTWFATLNDAANQLDALLDRALPQPVRTLSGATFVLEDYSPEPRSVTAHATISGDHAPALLGMLLNQLGMNVNNVVPDGRPLPIPIGMLGMPPNITAHGAASVGRAAIAVGPASAAKATKALNAPMPKSSPLATMAMDGPRLRELGLLDEKDDDTSTMRHLSLQLDVQPGALVLDMFGAF